MKLYRVREADAIRQGLDPAYLLYDPQHISAVWVDELDVTLPEGYTVETAESGEPIICDPSGEGCLLVHRGGPAVYNVNSGCEKLEVA